MRCLNWNCRCAAIIVILSAFCHISVAFSQSNISRDYSASLDTSQMQQYLNKKAEEITQNALRQLGDNASLERNKESLRKQFRYMLGLDPLPERTPLNVRITGVVDRPEYTIEKIIFESVPKFYVTGNLYKPKSGTGAFPSIIYVCGHTHHDEGSKIPYQVHGQLMARNGYIMFIIDPIQIAEVYGIHHGTCSYNFMYWPALGYTPSAVDVWNAMRAIDYLKSRRDVDPDRIGMTGLSGGGSMTWFTGAADERINAPVPANATGTIEMHVKTKIIRGHCDCAYFPNLYQLDWTTLAALMSPRPLRLHNATMDAAYPPFGYNKVVADAREIYRGYGKEDYFADHEIVAVHKDTSVFRQAALEWFNKWFDNPHPIVREEPYPQEPPEVLSVLNGKIPPDNINALIQEKFIKRAELNETFNTRDAWQSHKSRVMDNLREYVFRNMPKKMGKISFRIINESMQNERVVKSIIYKPEEGIELNARFIGSPGNKQGCPSILYIASPGETIRSIQSFLFDAYYRGNVNILIVFPRSVGFESWNEQYYWYVRRAAYLLGTTLNTMQLWDVIASLDVLEAQPTFDGRSVVIFGQKEMGIIGLYAGLMDQRITKVVLFQPPESHIENPIFMNVLRYTDIPEAVAMFAPKPVICLTPIPEEFGYARDIYELYDAENNLRRLATMMQVIREK